MNECRKCHKRLHSCDACKGQSVGGIGGGKLTCRQCNSTGAVCLEHGGHWK